ncbi:MAG: APC family permease [Mycoplasmoidaceae bacterium]
MKKAKNKSNKLDSSSEPKVQSISEASTSKKISFFSAMLVVVGSSVGAGIFLRSASVLGHAQGSLPLAILSWLVAAFAVIAMALSLIEIASARNDNLSLIGWCKTFNSRIMYKASKNFMFYIYLPLTYFFMPMYVIMQLQDGIGVWTHTTVDAAGVVDLVPYSFGTEVDWLIWSAISLVISIYFIFSAGLSSKIGNIQNLAISFVKFIPLLIAAFIGYAFIAMEGTGGIEPAPTPEGNYDPTRFSTFSPGFGMFLAVSGIFFAYDGFYVTAGLQTEMKEPKKTPKAILFGLIIVTGIYLAIAISMSLNGSGSFFGFGEWLVSENLDWLFGIVNILIAIGILGIINGFSLWAPRFTEDLIQENELPLSSKYVNKLNANKPVVGIAYTLIASVPIIILFSIIGALGFDNTGDYPDLYGSKMVALYSFCDIVANWTAVFAFAFIVAAIYGGIRNRKTKKIETQEYKNFMPYAISSVLIMSITLFFTVLTPVIDLMLIYVPSYNIANNPEDLLGRIMLVVVLLLFFAIMFVPTFVEDYIAKKKGPSKKEVSINIKENLEI